MENYEIIDASILNDLDIDVTLYQDDEIDLQIEIGSGGVSSYNQLSNKPSINGVQLIGDHLSDYYNLQDKMDYLTNTEIERLIGE